MSTVGTGSIRSYLNDVEARGRSKRRSDGHEVVTSGKPGVLLDLLVHQHDGGKVIEDAGDVAADPMVDGLLSSAIHFIKHMSPELIGALVHKAAEDLHETLPRLSPEGRRDLRAALFLAAMGLQRTSPEVIKAVLAGLGDRPSPPPSVRQVVGLLGIIFFKGVLPFGDPKGTTEACRELWRIAREDEAPETVEDAWDMATLAEADLEEDAPVPFVPSRATG
ncbi:MAG TPA: hypothetical protein VHG72_17445 [Polyangia bacterium]|nr:hypothetical protein [Polyangia bacterium]